MPPALDAWQQLSIDFTWPYAPPLRGWCAAWEESFCSKARSVSPSNHKPRGNHIGTEGKDRIPRTPKRRSYVGGK